MINKEEEKERKIESNKERKKKERKKEWKNERKKEKRKKRESHIQISKQDSKLKENDTFKSEHSTFFITFLSRAYARRL